MTKEKAKKKKKPKEASSVEIRQRLEMADNIDDLFNEGGMIMQDKARKKLKKVEGNEDSDEELSEQQSEEEEEKIEDINLSAKPAQLRPKANPSKPSSAAAVLDPDSFVKPTKITGSANFEMNEAEEASDEDKSDGDDDDQGAAIAEAFADDDIGNEFQSEKEALKKARQAKKIDLTLPGWGDWGGHGIKVGLLLLDDKFVSFSLSFVTFDYAFWS